MEGFYDSGLCLKDIIDLYKLELVFIERGTILVFMLADMRFFFELQDDFDYRAKTGIFHRGGVMYAVPGTVANGDGEVDDKTMILPDHVRFPSPNELEWYNGLETV